MIEHRNLLNDIAVEYRVQPRFIVAIWGMETNFGTFPITEPLFSTLATLAYDRRRAEFYRIQFFAALSMLDSGFPPYEKMKSSWAGAMGQSQFIPESYLRYAVDHDKNGVRDIWDSEADVLAVKLHPNLTHYPRIFASNFDPWIMPEHPENTRSARVNY